MTGSHVLWHPRSSWQTHHTGYFVTHSVTHSLWQSASPQNTLLSAFFNLSISIYHFSIVTRVWKKYSRFRDSFLENWIYSFHIQIYFEFWDMYPYIDMFRLSIGTLTKSKWGHMTHVTQCHIMSRDVHVKFRDGLVTSSSTLFTNLNIWSLKKTFKVSDS